MFLECLHLNTWIFFIHRGCTAVNKSANCFLMQNAVLFEREDGIFQCFGGYSHHKSGSTAIASSVDIV